MRRQFWRSWRKVGTRESAPPRAFLNRIVGYGASRAAVQGLFAGRGVLLAGILGPELLGVWALFRISIRYLAFTALGALRGLELEVSRAGTQPDGSAEQVRWARAVAGQTAVLYGGLSVLASLAWFCLDRGVANAAFLGIAGGLLLDRFFAYGLAFLRAGGGLRRFAVVELAHAGLQAAACVCFALAWGLPGAFAGFAAANLVGLVLLAGRVPFRPVYDFDRVRRLIRVGFPVSAMGIISATFITADRVLVGALLGLSSLGMYAFAVSISEIGVNLAGVIRTVIFKDVYADGATSALLDRAMLLFASLAPPLLAFVALLLPVAINAVIDDYSAAVPAAQLLLFAGLSEGLTNVAVLGVIAAERHKHLPLIALAALGLNVVLTIAAISAGLGLQGVAAGALVSRAVHSLALVVVLQFAQAPTAATNDAFRFLFPTLWYAAVVLAIGYFLPIDDIRSLLIGYTLLTVATIPLLPMIARAWYS